MAHVRLIDKLKNHSEFTQMADIGGVKVGGVAAVDGMEVVFESART